MTAGVLLSLDLLLFYLFWEGMLIPLYFLLANYGNENRGRATLKFIIYTVAGSLLMLIAIISLDSPAGRGSFDLTELLGGQMSRSHGGHPTASTSAPSVPNSGPSSASPPRLPSRSRWSRSTRGFPTCT